MANIIEVLRETLIVKNLSPEEAAGYIGCSGAQIRRWLKKDFEPTPVYVKAIKEGIEKIEKAIPGDKEGLVAWRKHQPSKEEGEINLKIEAVVGELLRVISQREREMYLPGDDAELIISNFLFLALTYGIKIPPSKELIQRVRSQRAEDQK